MDRRLELLSILTDGGFHSGEALARVLGVSRSAVWKHIQGLTHWGLDVFAVRGRGYSLAHNIRLLDHQDILSKMPPVARGQMRRLELFPVIDSTNGYLLDAAKRGCETGYVCLAESQTQGRGRRGKPWVSPFGRNLYMSVLWRFAQPPSSLGGLGLVVGVAVAEALSAAGGKDIGLKWPNDLYWKDRKLGGILLEMFGEAGGPSAVVLGVGVNVLGMIGESMTPGIDQPWSDFATAACESSPCRNTLAALILSEIFTALSVFECRGLAPFVPRWNALDVLKGREVDVHLPSSTVCGVADGIDGNGALRVLTGGQWKKFVSGELSVRLAPG